jgi:hypothetical protein
MKNLIKKECLWQVSTGASEKNLIKKECLWQVSTGASEKKNQSKGLEN